MFSTVDPCRRLTTTVRRRPGHDQGGFLFRGLMLNRRAQPREPCTRVPTRCWSFLSSAGTLWDIGCGRRGCGSADETSARLQPRCTRVLFLGSAPVTTCSSSWVWLEPLDRPADRALPLPPSLWLLYPRPLRRAFSPRRARLRRAAPAPADERGLRLCSRIPHRSLVWRGVPSRAIYRLKRAGRSPNNVCQWEGRGGRA